MVLLPEDFALPCQVQKVEEVPNWMEFLSVLTTESDAYCHDPEAHSDKMHVLLYLSSRHWNEAKDKKALVVSNYGSGSSGGNKNKTHQTRKYNRMAFFADLLSPGRVCCKITDTQHESLGFFENMIHGGYGIGWIYILEEPRASTQHLGGSNSIAMLDSFTRVYPVTCDMAKVIPSAPLERPDQGDTKYFAYHHCKNLVVGASTVESSFCGGRFCDRQIPAGGTPGNIVACGCFHRRDKYKIITEHTLQIPCEANIDENRSTIVPHFRSLRFDELLFRDGSQHMFDSTGTVKMGDPIANHVLRSHVSKLVKHVNSHDGWTIVGWTRTGTVKDASEEGNRDAEDIAAEDVKPHVTYLFPTNPEDVDAEKVEAYKALFITTDTFRREMKEEKLRLEAKKQQQTTPLKRRHV